MRYGHRSSRLQSILRCPIHTSTCLASTFSAKHLWEGPEEKEATEANNELVDNETFSERSRACWYTFARFEGEIQAIILELLELHASKYAEIGCRAHGNESYAETMDLLTDG